MEGILAKASQEALGNAVTEGSSHVSVITVITWYLEWLLQYEKAFVPGIDKILGYLSVGKCRAWLSFCISHN